MKIVLILFIATLHQLACIAQVNSSLDCNNALLTTRPDCDSLRWNFSQPRINYDRMLRRDRGIIFFLNDFKSDTIKIAYLFHELKRHKAYNITSIVNPDTSYYRCTIANKGLIKLVIKFWYNDNTIYKRYYDIEINNPPGAGFSRPLDYHYRVFSLLNFCLGRRFSCYNFEDEF